jgi:hypothetical protein
MELPHRKGREVANEVLGRRKYEGRP